jgi:hypothetical protein
LIRLENIAGPPNRWCDELSQCRLHDQFYRASNINRLRAKRWTFGRYFSFRDPFGYTITTKGSGHGHPGPFKIDASNDKEEGDWTPPTSREPQCESKFMEK